ncbi:MAG: hypothetical protein K0U84_05095 [Actinomycetia bacterium]|nr:hypothetical protein [Actinomycetes bacterium]
MFGVLLARDDGSLYLTEARSGEDIAVLVGDPHPEILTSSDMFDFWFPSRAWHERINHVATEILFAHTNFDARSVPLLRGNVVVCTRDRLGSPTGITQAQLDSLSEGPACGRDRRLLGLRCAREEERHEARLRAIEETAHIERRYGS